MYLGLFWTHNTSAYFNFRSCSSKNQKSLSLWVFHSNGDGKSWPFPKIMSLQVSVALAVVLFLHHSLCWTYAFLVFLGHLYSAFSEPLYFCVFWWECSLLYPHLWGPDALGTHINSSLLALISAFCGLSSSWVSDRVAAIVVSVSRHSMFSEASLGTYAKYVLRKHPYG